MSDLYNASKDHLQEKWAVYQLADDEATYGLENAGKWIITCNDHNVEVTGVIGNLIDAEHIVGLHNQWYENHDFTWDEEG